MWLLKSTDGNGQVLQFPFYKPRMTLGRDPSNDIVLTDRDVSRWHALFVHDGARLVVHDRRSTNGTYVNSVRMHDPRRLEPGDLLILGSNLFAVAREAQAAGASSQAKAAGHTWATARLFGATEPEPFPGAFDRTLAREKFDLFESAFEKKRQVERFPRLLVTAPDADQCCYLLGMPVLRIGCGPDCHVRLTDPSIAAHHAEVRVGADGSWLVDQSRVPGTFVNGRRVRRHRLRDGDIIDLGAVRVRYRHAEDLKAKVAGFLRDVMRPRAADTAAAQPWPSAMRAM